MHVRVLALALLAVVGAACAHTRSEESAQTTRTGQPSDTATAQQGQAEKDRAASAPAAPPSDQNRNPSASDPSSEPSSSDITRSGTAAGTTGDVTRDPIMEPGEAAKGHADDQLVSGKLSRVTRRTVVIDADTGDQRTLYLAPETSFVIDGQDARRTDLQQGQDVRASFSNVEGRDIAVEIHVGEDAATKDEGPGSAIQTDDPTNQSGSGRASQPPSER